MTKGYDSSAVLHFWFHEVTPVQWWKVDPAFDRTVGERFRAVHQAAVLGEFSHLYMPFMHSESAVIHEAATSLFQAPGLESLLEFELRHKAIIDRFGRCTHRNASLGRVSTEQELRFLEEPDSSF